MRLSLWDRIRHTLLWRHPRYRFACDFCEQPHYPGHPCPPEPMTEIRDDAGNVIGYCWTWAS